MSPFPRPRLRGRGQGEGVLLAIKYLVTSQFNHNQTRRFIGSVGETPPQPAGETPGAT